MRSSISHLAPGECTIAYVSDDARSLLNFRAEVYAEPSLRGLTGIADGCAISGTRDAEVTARDLLDTVLTTGQEHHYGFVHGDITEELSELGEWMAWREIKPLQYRDALQHVDRHHQNNKEM